MMNAASKMIEYQSVRINRVDLILCRRVIGRFFQCVADAADRVDELGGESVLDFPTEAIDHHIDNIGFAVEVDVPDMLHEDDPGEDPALVSKQILKQLKFLIRQGDVFAGPLNPAS